MSFINTLFSKSKDVEAIFQKAFEAETKHNNFERALSLYEKAANLGYAKAQYYCGFMYLKGRGTKRNHQKALSLVEQAAQQNHPHGQYLLAQMYLSGEGVKKDEQIGNEWMEKFRSHNLLNEITLCFHNY
jgi:TPR repeat protein